MPQKPTDDVSDFPDQSTSDFPDQKKGFFQGALADIPKDIWDQIQGSSSAAMKHIHEGNYPGAFHDIASPILDPFEELIKGSANKLEGRNFAPPASRPEAAAGVAGFAGLPSKSFSEALAAKDYPRIAGQATTAGALYLLGRSMHGGGGERPTVEDIPAHPPTPPSAPVGDINLPPERPPVRGPNVPHDWLPFESLPEDRPPSEPLPTEQPGLQGFGADTEPQQQGLPFGAYQGPNGRFTSTGPGRATTVRPFLDEPFQNRFDFEFPDELSQTPEPNQAPIQSNSPTPPEIPPPITPEPPAPEAQAPIEQPAAEPGVDVVDGKKRVTRGNWNKAQIAYWKSKGYVSGGIDENGHAYMIEGPTAPLMNPPPVSTPDPARGAIGQNEIPLNQNTVTIPTHQATDSTVAVLKRYGLELAEETPDGQSIFRRNGGETGAVDLDSIRRALRDWFGREPNDQEVQLAAFNRNAGQSDVQPGESTGNVAPFTPREPQLGDQLPDFPRDRFGNRLQLPGDPEVLKNLNSSRLSDEYDMENMPGPEDPRWSDSTSQPVSPDILNQIGEQQASGDINQVRQQNVLDPNRPRPVMEGIDHPPFPMSGQQELPLGPSSELTPRELPEDAWAGRNSVERPITEPTQHQLNLDLNKFIQGDTESPTSVSGTIKRLANRILNDEVGAIGPQEALDQVRREINARRGRSTEEGQVVQDAADLREITDNNDYRMGIAIRDFWQGEVERLDRSNDPSAQKHANTMVRRARMRLQDLDPDSVSSDQPDELTATISDRTQPTTSDPVAGPEWGRHNTANDNLHVDTRPTRNDLYQLHHTWYDRFNEAYNDHQTDRTAGHDERMNYAHEMMQRTNARLTATEGIVDSNNDPLPQGMSSTDNTVPPEPQGRWEVVNMHDESNPIARFHTEHEAQNYLTSHPNEPFGYRDTLEAPSARQQTNTGHPDVQEIRDATTVEELRRLYREHLGDQLDAADANDPAQEQHHGQMINWITDRLEDEFGVDPQQATPNQPTGTSTQHPRTSTSRWEVFDPSDGTPIAFFERGSQARDYIDNQPNGARLDYDLIGDSTGSNFNPPNATTPPIPTPPARPMHPSLNAPIDTLRARTGVLNPPFEFGLQEPVTGRRARLSREQMDRLLGSAGTTPRVNETPQQRRAARKATQASAARQRASGTVSTWDRFAAERLADIQPGPAGLSIEDKSTGPYFKRYKVVYRAPDGSPVGMAEVSEDSSGKRYVPNFAIDRTKGFLIRSAFVNIGDALSRMNALDTGGGIISDYTANVIAHLFHMMNNEQGSVKIGMLLGDLFKGKEAGSTEGDWATKLAGLTEGMTGDKNLRWTIGRLRDETGAIKLPSMEGAKEGIRGVFKEGPNEEPSTFDEALALPGAAMTGMDVSMPLRQGLPQLFTPEWRKALKPMFQAAWSPELDKQIMDQVKSNPIHQTKYNPVTEKEIPSIAKQIGVTLIENGKINKSEYSIGSNWIENGGNIPYLSKGYRETIGRGYRASNRAAATFLNVLRTTAAEKLLNEARDMSVQAQTTGKAPYPGIMGGVKTPDWMGGKQLGFMKSYTPEEAANLNPYTNSVLARQIGDFVNTATGRAPLKTDIFPVEGAPQINLEKSAGILARTLFSPRGLFTKIRLLNPNTYIMADPFVRKQYLKAALSAGAGWYGMTQLIKGAGAVAGYDVNVSDDPNSADFGKPRIGNTRLDPGGGFQQFLVLGHRLWSGHVTSAASVGSREFELGQGYRPPTRWSTVENFMANKLNPVTKFAYDMLNASEHQPFHVLDRSAQNYIPLIIGDLIDVYKEDPSLLPGLAPFIALGGGSQHYDRGESEGKFIPPENDIIFKGGGNMSDFFPQ